MVEVETEQTGMSDKGIITARGESTGEGGKIEVRTLVLSRLFGVGNSAEHFRLLACIRTRNIKVRVVGRDVLIRLGSGSRIAEKGNKPAAGNGGQ